MKNITKITAIFGLTSIIMMYYLAPAATACCSPACGPCKACVNRVCVDTCVDHEICCDGTCCSGSGCCPVGKKCCSGTCQQCCGNGDCSSSNCQVCQGGVCVSTCAGGEVCVNGVCKQPCTYSSDCDSEKCEVCVNGYCEAACNPDDCENCNGAGNCVNPCDTNACQSCDGQGNCVSACDPCACKECDGVGHCVTICDHNECEQCDGAGNCVSFCDLNCQECNGYGNCIDILVTSISSDITIACVECSIHFVATAVPAEYEDKIRWSAPGGDPNSGSGSGFSTNWASPGQKTVTARICASSKAKDVTIVGIDKIQVYAEASWQEVTDCNMVVLQGTKYTFKALPAPQGAGWPSGSPIWSGAASGSGETIEATFATGGAKTLTAKCGSCGDTGKSVNIEVIVPEPNQVGFVDNNPGEEHDIYGITDPLWTQDNPTSTAASYTMGKYVKMEAQFWAEKNLTFATEVWVGLNFPGAVQFSADTGVAFKNWPSETTTHVSVDPLYNYIGANSNLANWSYLVPSGTNEWISMSPVTGPHAIYRIYAAPTCASSDYTELNIYEAVVLVQSTSCIDEPSIASYANDRVDDTVDCNCICFDGFQRNFDAAMGIYPPQSDSNGMCCCRAEGLDCVLNVLGIGPYNHDYVNEHAEPNPSRLRGASDQYCSTCGKWCYRKYWDSFWNNWEGVVKAGGNGSTCYAPANGAISIDEGTYSQIDSAIATDCGYYWHWGPYQSNTCPHLSPP